MEFEEDEDLPQHPKRSKPANPVHFPSISVLPIPNLPAELIIEILLKLPVKSLVKFRSVSKSWIELISSPHFVKTHLLLSGSNKNYTHHGVTFMVASTANLGFKVCSLRALLYHPVTEAFDLDYPGKNPDDHPRLVGSINGLICLAIRILHGFDDLYLWNPSIRKYKKLPSYTLNLNRRDCEVRLDDFNFGFAYDEFQDDYKVVGIFPIYRRGRLCRVEVNIYSLKSNSWRRIDDFQGRELLYGPAKFVNDKLHWTAWGRDVISFDLADEKWSEVEQPSCFKGCEFLKLGMFGSDLSAFCNYARTHVDVWVMTDYGVKESWTKMFTVKSPDDSTGIFYPPILMSNEGEILLQFGSRFTKYNPKDDLIRYLDVTGVGPYIEAEIYVKSLVCPFFTGETTNAPTTEAEITQTRD
ncbi:F-box/kelch-repeat protein At3g23880-like isoform X3 [Lycium ferocissimum]|uniref:F-box/kelch-repeat protein At3g23880-like isoform X3 n=1 Tax=Lycium ferocissimum TaxID=112874 RepID=UPI0028168CCC|nr:F-box/kelch-repeat protein At3g23880-like isoform X3 [Lycium ferocissimum]XP_059313791.1 F-box/kelch-repeat protein At3g23880-like isoform X3 [Lycium ferocissimum]XP_059313857.1 F-box/kelch-repeat protein At3g23880-like isoform X3 [Lycium ferocissimum]